MVKRPFPLLGSCFSLYIWMYFNNKQVANSDIINCHLLMLIGRDLRCPKAPSRTGGSETRVAPHNLPVITFHYKVKVKRFL